MESNLIKKIIFNKYQILQFLKKSSNASLYQGINIQTNIKVAIKIERKSYKIKAVLKDEGSLLSMLSSNYIPKLLCYGESQTHNFLVIQLLSITLEDLFSHCNNKFSLLTISRFAIDLIKMIQLIHAKNIIHRNITPSNIMIGIDETVYNLYMIHFNLIQEYRNDTNGHIPLKGKMYPIGDVKYCSVNSLLRYELSRRDDLESIGYVLIYLTKGYLPWDQLKVNKNENLTEKIEEKKKFVSIEDLCSHLPRQFEDYMKYVKGLEFQADPDYTYMTNLFTHIMLEQGITTINKQIDYEWSAQSINKMTKKFKEGTVPVKSCDHIDTKVFDYLDMDIDKSKLLVKKVLDNQKTGCACIIF